MAHPLCVIAADVAASRAAVSRMETRLFTSGRAAFGVNTQQSADRSLLPQFVWQLTAERCSDVNNNTAATIDQDLFLRCSHQTEHIVLEIPSELLQSDKMSDL